MQKEILKHLEIYLQQDSKVHALWLEGSQGTGTNDQYSDIDINVDVEDGYELTTLGNIQRCLEQLGTLDLISAISQPNEYLWYQVFHIGGTNKHLFIDVTIQRHSRNYSFCRQDTTTIPVILFDKANVIRFHELDSDELQKSLKTQLADYRARIAQASRVEKYIARGQFLEAWAYYQKYILESVVGIARIIHTPLNTDYGLVRISHQMPTAILQRLEDLYQISSLRDIEKKLPIAIQFFRELEVKYLG